MRSVQNWVAFHTDIDKRILMHKKIIAIILTLFISYSLISQNTSDSSANLNTAGYSYSGTINEADQLKILTYIWGQIERPGLYIVPDDTDVLTLISLAGGPTVDARLKSIRIIRKSLLGEETVINVDMKKYIETGDYSLIPQLMPGDTVIVSGTSFYAFSRVVTFLSQVAITLSVYLTIQSLF